MPLNREVNMDKLSARVQEKVKAFSGNDGEVKLEPVAYGLNSIRILFIYSEDKGDTEPLEKEIKTIDGVSSIEVIDVRRAIG